MLRKEEPAMRRIVILLLLLMVLAEVSAQNTNTISVLAKPKADGVWLRWAPPNPTVWQLGNKYGYMIERFTMLPNGELENLQGEKLTTSPLKPLSLADLNALSASVREADVLAELIYDEDAAKPVKSGDPYAALERNQDNENKYGVALLVCDLSTDVAKAAGLFLSDTKAVQGKRYIYRVSLAHVPKGVQVAPGVIVLDVTEEKPMLAIKDLKAEFRDKQVSLSWSTLLHSGIYSSYKIEKSVDGKNFKAVSELPYVHMSDSPENETAFFVDSLEQNSKTFYYRIAGMSPFGETGPPSNVVSGEGKDNLSGYLVIREGKVVADKKINVGWEFPVEAEKQIKGFIVRRANKADGPYTDAHTQPLATTVRAFTDVTPYYNTYYIVVGVDKSGNEVTQSFPFLIQVEDNTPPVTPAGLKGSISKDGFVKLDWTANTDNDFLGYRVFKANAPTEEFVEVTRTLLFKPAYVDTIKVKVLNRKIYYRVVAVDRNYNNSEFSPILTLSKPDLVAPVEPIFTKAEIVNSTISLRWINSTSPDVAKVELIRLEKEDRINRVVKTWSGIKPEDTYVDLSPTPGKTYLYKVAVYDSSGNVTEANSPHLYFETGHRNAVSDVKAEVDRDKRLVKFQWKNPGVGTKSVIYRRKNDEPLVIYKTLEGNVESFEDKSITINNRYTYRVQVIFDKGIKSNLSEEINVIY